MRNRWASTLAAPIVCGALLIGCGGSDDASRDQQAQQPPTTRPEQATTGSQAQTTVALSGCVEGAPGTDQFMLRHVRFEPRQEDPQRQPTAANVPGITEGSWVRLDGREHPDELQRLAGQRVTLTGLVEDSGRNTIGTAGTSGNPIVSGDKSQAASDKDYPDKIKAEAGRIARESMANGMAALVKVTAVQSTGERCAAENEGAAPPR